jgi:hypothetical protein
VSDKKVWLGVFGGGGLLAAALGYLIYAEYGAIDDGRNAVATLGTQIAGARQTLTKTPALEREVIVLRETEEVIQSVLPDQEDVYNLNRTLSGFSVDTGVEIKGLKVKPPENNATKQSTDFDKVAYALTIEADAFQLLAFMDRIESHSRFMRIPELRLSAAPRRRVEETGQARHKIQLDIETYVYRPQNGPDPVRIESYERKRELLLGEINRRRQALRITTYDYRGDRSRRDPWIDPRQPVPENPDSAWTVEEQKAFVDAQVERMDELKMHWEAILSAQNVIEEMTRRADFEEVLAHLEEELRRIDEMNVLSYRMAASELQLKVRDPLAELHQEMAKLSVNGPSKERLTEVFETMERHFDAGEYELTRKAFETVEKDLDFVEVDEVRGPIVADIRDLAMTTQIVLDFERIDMDIKGVAIMDDKRFALINGKTLGEGDLLGNELIIRAIAPGAIEFIFRGVVLERRFQ